MQDDSGEDCAGGAGGASQDGISVLDELCVGSQVYDATAPVLHDDMGGGSMQLALIGDGVSVESPSPNYMEYPVGPVNRMEPAVETASASSGTPMASSKPHHSGDQSTASATAT